MTTELDEDRGVADEQLSAELPSAGPSGDDRAEFVARVILESFGGRAICEHGPRAAAVAARRIAHSRTGGTPISLEKAAARAGLDVPTVARAENCLLEALSPPAAPAEVERLQVRVERCRQVLIATARERAGPPRLTTVLCGPGTPEDVDPDEVVVPEDVDPLPPGESVEELKAYYHRLQSDLRCARLGFALYERVVEAELPSPE